MNRRVIYVLTVLLLTALACNLPISGITPTPAQPTVPPNQATVAIPSATATQAPTEEASPTETSSPTATLLPSPTATLAAPINTGPVVLGNLKADPAQLTVVDPLTGQAKQSFTAPGLIAASPVYAAADAIFYLDSSFKKVLWAGYDGSNGELSFMNTGGGIFNGFILPSPDGKQIAWSYLIADQTNQSFRNQLIIADKDGGGETVVADEISKTPVAWTPIAWSNDGQSIYFASEPYGIGGYILFNGVLDVRRVPVIGGTAQIVLPALSSMEDVAVSPDNNTLAYIHSTPSADGSTVSMELNFLQIGAIKTRSVTLPAGYLQSGAITWSPDSQSLVLSLAVGDPNQEAYSLVQVDATSLATKMLLTKDTRLLEPVTWPVVGALWLKDTNGSAWRMDMPGGTLTQVAKDQTVLPTGWH